MARKEHIIKYTDNELTKLVKQEGTLSDWGKAASMTKADIEELIASDSDEAGMVMDWDKATFELPEPKAVLNMRIDKDVLEFFRKTGKFTSPALTLFCGHMLSGESITKKDKGTAHQNGRN